MTRSATNHASQPSMTALAVRQVEAIDAWNAAREQREQALSAMTLSREERLDAARRRDMFRCTADAMIARTTAQWLDSEPEPITGTVPLRAVIAHRQPWFATKVTAALAERDMTVVAVTDHGAQALGMVVAEQPDLVLVEDTLAMLSGAELIAEVTRFAPWTVTAAQVQHSDRIGALLDAGAKTAFSRQVPPEDVADQAATLVHNCR